jgi:integrase
MRYPPQSSSSPRSDARTSVSSPSGSRTNAWPTYSLTARPYGDGATVNTSGAEFRHEGVHACLGWIVPVSHDEILAGYLQHLRRLRRSPVTIRQYSVLLTVWFRFCESHNVGEPDRADLEAFLDEHPEWVPGTANLYLTAISNIYVWAMAHGFASTNPVAGFQRPKMPGRQPHPISEADLERAIAHAAPSMAAILQLGARAGLRAKEIAQLHTRDITLGDRPTLRIASGKGNKTRVVPLAPRVADAIEAIAPENGFVFPGRHPGPTDHSTCCQPASISRMVTRHFQALGIDSSCNELRHRFLTEYYGATKDIRSTQELAGHVNIATTAGYIAINVDDAGEVVDKL